MGPTVNEKDISPVIESVEFKIEKDTENKESFEIIETTEELRSIKEESAKSVQIQPKHSEESSDEEYDIVSKTEIEEAKEQFNFKEDVKESTKPDVQHQKALINIQSASSSDSESDQEKSIHSSADHSETSENKDIAESQDEAPIIADSVTTTDTEAVESRPSSSDFSEIY